MIKKDDPILIFGAGSIGERHIHILQKCGYSNIWIYRQRNLALRNVDAKTINIFTDLNRIDEIKPKAAIICTPTFQHLKQTLFCVERGIHVLVEKPLSHNLTDYDKLLQAAIQNTTYVQLAYMLRYHDFFQNIKSLVENRKMGNLIGMQTYWGEYLPDWHPWEDYQSSYAARKELGGGAALTLSHDIDLVNWLSGSPVNKWQTLKNYRSSLQINVESGADISIGYQNGITAHCHVNFHEQKTKRWYRFVFDEGSIEYDYYKSVNTTYHQKETIINTIPDFDRNQLYELQTLHFFRQINEGNFREASLRSIEESKVIISICQ
ncbi:Gfo/Idh/MocA family protein [Dyadobacter frigoris]|uniref:Gfo/Idh/MocA family oxidoreductase n=1 Tax=Dyadobacter frigoris TaxID=2576211 RepID=A0A4V6BJJ3_9BACT|nr:Gfo/Idh/MocA family oxidoreductase [Dyadobacter frigoris]TKT94133.1 Gfo/Idh/MocA family oxidoreductase [Dyadobacter frigoris]GLU50656.1 oxidoreductase [Dyadobacter frigoris]